MGKTKLKEKAIKLRAEGKTFLEIQKRLQITIPKSTLSYWCKSVPLPFEYSNRIKLLNIANSEKGRRVALEVNKIKRKQYLDNLVERNKYLSSLLSNQNIAKIALAMLYLGEGGKWKSHRGLLLGSSDPDIIKIYIKLLQKCYNIPLKKMRARILYRADQDINFLTAFWSRITGIPRYDFYKTKPDPRTIGKKTKKKDYRGVCVVTCGGTEIQLELDIIAKMFLQI